MSSNGNLLNARQVAERLNVSIAWVASHASGRYRPVLPSVKMGRTVRFRESEIDAFVEHCRRAMERGIPIQ